VKWRTEYNGWALPLPRFWALLTPGAPEHEDTMSLGVMVSDGHSDAIVSLSVEFPWPRPRPWQLELEWPSRPYTGRLLVWSKP
jgi:hypothetical protein